jgi:ABC-type transport system involved in multi-copper enzyme maturation permease subunit
MAATASLIRKSWLETRDRFLGSSVILALLGLFTTTRASATIAGWEHFHAGERMPYALYVWLSLSHGYLQFIWIICAIILGLGGLLREQSLGTAGVTLALPLSRERLVIIRAMVGAIEVAILAFIPGVIVAALSPLTGHSYPFTQALLFASLIVGGGLVFYALAFVASHLLSSEYAAPSIALALTAAYYVLSKLPHMGRISVFELMTGARYMNSATFLLDSDYPAAPIGLSIGAAAALIVAAYALVRRRDF